MNPEAWTVMVSTVLAQLAAQRFKLDWSHTGGLTMIINMILLKFSNGLSGISGVDIVSFSVLLLQNIFSFTTFLGLAITTSIVILYRHVLQKQISMRSGGDDYVMKIYTKEPLDVFLEYLKHNPNIFAMTTCLDFGNPLMLATAYAQSSQTTVTSHGHYKPDQYHTKSIDEIQERGFLVKPPNNTVISFVDTNFNVSGTYCWREINQDVTTVQTTGTIKQMVPVSYIELCIKPRARAAPKAAAEVSKVASNDISFKHPSEYITCLRKWNQSEREKTLTLYMAKVLAEDGECYTVTHKTYSGPRRTFEELEKHYIHTFFQPEKAKLWDLIKTVARTPERILARGQFPQAGILLHGPPGTGKSSFAYRVAMTLNRHIVNVDVRTLHSRTELYQIMRKPWISGQQYEAKDVVFVFDEFDLTVKELVRRQSQHKQLQDRWYSSSLSPVFSDADVSTAATKPATSATSTGKKVKQRFDMDTADQIQLNDLLEILQGVVPSHQSLVFATTNHYKELEDACPALFRVGRLSPTLFGYFNLATIDEFTKFHFSECCNDGLTGRTSSTATYPSANGANAVAMTAADFCNDNKNVHVCPSAIVEALAEATSRGDVKSQYEYFQHRIKILVSENLCPASTNGGLTISKIETKAPALTIDQTSPVCSV